VAIRYEITGRKRIEEELRESNTLLRSVIEGSSDAIYLKDTWGRYLMANSSAAEIIGKPPEEILGKSDDELFPAEVARPLMEADRQIMTTGTSRTLEEHVPVAGRVRTFYSTKAPYRDHRGEVAGVIGVSSDITELKKTEEVLREIREGERGRIARELHDVVLQDLTYALQTVQSTSAADGGGVDLEDAATALRRSVRGLRGALHNLRAEEESGSSFVRSVQSLAELNRRMNPECEVELDVDEGFSEKLPEKANGDLLRIVQEALANARRHSRARRVQVRARTSGQKLRVEVSDDGRGFDPDEVSPGLGTKGMHERARALGGELGITSKPGEGTTVRLELEAGKYGKESGEPPVEKSRILLVDDHASFRQGVVSALEGACDVEIAGQAGSLSEAREVLAEKTVDIGIFDLGLPDGYGGDLIKELRASNPRAQALVLSASEDRAEIARAVESGAAGVLHKSSGMDEVAEAIRRLQAGETLLALEKVVELLRFAGVRREQEYEARQAISRLTDREKEVLQALGEGLDADEIARRLHISAKTERNHVASILAKLGVHSRLQALVFAARHGVVEIGHEFEAGE
jgi:PAS domain S-box-containing protein